MGVGKIIKSRKMDEKSGVYKDEFGDSKFGLDLINYFPREMIQNPLDVRNDKNKPLEVEFVFEELEVERIPGIKDLKAIIEACIDMDNVQIDTKNQYKRMITQIDSGKVMCLKISDRNTTGVIAKKDGVEHCEIENDSWNAMVYNDGHTVKNEMGSGGRHGVGKKVAYMVSNLRTVFYYTYNKGGIEMFMGKSKLTDFRMDEKMYLNKVWFGKVGKDEYEYLPLTAGELSDIDPFFYHTGEFGTDIVIIGIDEIGGEHDIEIIKKKIVYGILDNFFVAIMKKELVVKIQEIVLSNVGEYENKFDEILETYKEDYEKEYTKLIGDEYLGKIRGGKSNLQYGNLFNYINAMKYGEERIIPVMYQNKNVGNAHMYIINENSFGKKYVSIFRKHGMKIMDLGPVSRANTPFSAVICIEGEKLNMLLGDSENAAHDDFDVWDDLDSKKMYDKMIEDIKNEIKRYTKIEVEGEIPIDDIEAEDVSFWGDRIQANIVEKEVKVNVRRLDVNRKKHQRDNGNGSKTREPKQKKIRDKKDRNTGKIIEGKYYRELTEFVLEPLIQYDKTSGCYSLDFELVQQVDNILIDLCAVSRDYSEESIIKEYIAGVEENGQKYKVNYNIGTIRKDNIARDKRKFDIKIRLKKDLRYQIKARIYTQLIKERETNE